MTYTYYCNDHEVLESSNICYRLSAIANDNSKEIKQLQDNIEKFSREKRQLEKEVENMKSNQDKISKELKDLESEKAQLLRRYGYH